MKPLPVEAFLALMEPADWDELHLTVCDASGMTGPLERATLEQVLRRLPPSVLATTLLDGFASASPFAASRAIEWRVRHHGSLEAWLANALGRG